MNKPTPTFIRLPIRFVLRPFQEFVRLEASGGILLLICTIAALVWANSAWNKTYTDLWHTPITIGAGNLVLSKDLSHWINDGLMALFFFVVGLEIKREILAGELAGWRKAALPIFAALGGMVVPAAIYLALNFGTVGARGWGIPMATDIAFALGALTLLGKRVPVALKVFLTALAIVDDIGAVLVIALFYTSTIAWLNLAVAGLLLILLVAANRAGIRAPLVYGLLGIGLWLLFLQAGVHTTIAGVLLALTIPSSARIIANEFLSQSRDILSAFEKASEQRDRSQIGAEQQAALQELEAACDEVQTPLHQLETALHPWVTWFILPIFALANAGVGIAGDLLAQLALPVSTGVIAGLVIGKMVGISLFTWLAVKTRLAVLPNAVTWRQIYGVSWLGGIGFTMSLFIASLAFEGTPSLSVAKIGILTASAIAALIGLIIVRQAT